MYDLIIIGGGPAGGWASQKAVEAGLKPMLLEKRFLGGVCLNEGCVPSKALLHSAKCFTIAKESASLGVNVTGVTFDIKQAMARKEKIISGIRRGTESVKKKMNIPVLFEEATILATENNVFRVQSVSGIHAGKRLLICTGSQALKPAIPGADQSFVMTNREILSLDFVPSKLVIIGGGVIGLEFATFFAEIGSQVTVVEMLSEIAGNLDKEIRSILQQSLEKKGITIQVQAKVTAIGDHAVTFTTAAGIQETVAADVVLLSAGRKPVIRNIGLENIHVQVEKGAIVTDEHCRTNVPNVWAAGDVNGKSMLAHTAGREAEVAVGDMVGLKSRVRYETIPSVIYTHPEAASVGLTKEQATAQGFDVAGHSMPMSYNSRYLAETEGQRGLCKVIADKKLGTVLGVHVIGAMSSEIIAAAGVIIENELRVADVADMVFAHPTVAEIIKDTITEIKL